MQKYRPSKKPKVFHGYWIVAVTFCCLFIFSGAGYYAFSLFVRPLEAQFGWGRGEVALIPVYPVDALLLRTWH